MWSAIIENGTARLVAALSQVFVLVLTAWLLGAENRGVLVVVITWSALFAAVAGLSLGQVSHHEIQLRGTRDWLPDLAGTMLAMGVGLSIVAYAGFVLMSWLQPLAPFRGVPRHIVALAGLLIPLVVLDEYLRNLLSASHRARWYAVAQSTGGLLRAVLVYLAAGPLHSGVGGVLLGLVASQFLVVGLEMWAIRVAAGGCLKVNARYALSLLRGAMRLHPNTIASFLLAYSNVLLLSQLDTKSSVAWFQLALQLASTLLLLPQAAAMKFLGVIARDGPDAAWPEQRRAIAQVMCVVLLLAFVTAAVAGMLVKLVAGPEFLPAVELLRWLLPAMVGLSLAELLAPQWYGRGFFLLSTSLTVVVATANVALNYVFIARYGVVGAAWGTTISCVGVVVVAQLAFAAWCDRRSQTSAAAV